jgi:hypothetical protein
MAQVLGQFSDTDPIRSAREVAVRIRLYVDHTDAWIMERGSLINAMRWSVYPRCRTPPD